MGKALLNAVVKVELTLAVLLTVCEEAEKRLLTALQLAPRRLLSTPAFTYERACIPKVIHFSNSPSPHLHCADFRSTANLILRKSVHALIIVPVGGG